MNQIPNIEEIVKEKFYKRYANKVYPKKLTAIVNELCKDFSEIHPQQLQKAREEAVTRAMDEMLEYTHLGEQFIDGVRTLIEARGIKLSANHSELDQDKK